MIRKLFNEIELTFDRTPKVPNNVLEELCCLYEQHPEKFDSIDKTRKAYLLNIRVIETLKGIGVIKAVIRGFDNINGKMIDKVLLNTKEMN